KLLKTKAFILEKFLDTAFRCPIRFRQKVLMAFLELRWNYSPLKEKAVQLPDGLFVCFGTLLRQPLKFFLVVTDFCSCCPPLGAPVGFSASILLLCSTPLENCPRPRARTRCCSGLAACLGSPSF